MRPEIPALIICLAEPQAKKQKTEQPKPAAKSSAKEEEPIGEDDDESVDEDELEVGIHYTQRGYSTLTPVQEEEELGSDDVVFYKVAQGLYLGRQLTFK